MKKIILFTSLLRNNELFVDYFKKCLDSVEKDNSEYDFEYLFYINNNEDKTIEKLNDKKYNIIYEDLDDTFLKKDRFTKLAIFRQKLLEEAKKKVFDYMIMLDTDIMFNGKMFKETFKIIEKEDLEITGLNTIAYPLPFFYDWAPLFKDKFSIIKTIFQSFCSNNLIERDNFFNGFLIFKNTENFRKKINYNNDNNIDTKCEHEILCEKIRNANLKINIIPNITPLYTERSNSYYFDTGEEKVNQYENLYKKIEINDIDYRSLNFYFVILCCILISIILYIILK
jgi:hypothetical protein